MPESPKPSDPPSERGWRERAERELRRERDRWQRERERLRGQVDHLKRQLAEARRAGFRQAAPFAKPLKPQPKRPGRKPGAGYGPKARRRVPGQVDETHEAPLPVQCPACTGPIVETGGRRAQLESPR